LKIHHKKRAGGVAQGEGPEFKPQYCKKEKKKKAQLFMPVILTAWEAEIRRMVIPGKPRQKAKPYLQNSQGTKDWRCGSSSRACFLSTKP
jgi:hypothetical protein